MVSSMDNLEILDHLPDTLLALRWGKTFAKEQSRIESQNTVVLL